MARQMIKTTIETIETTGFAFKQNTLYIKVVSIVSIVVLILNYLYIS